ncbi:MAG: phosphate acyltransferase PlsX [Calditrichia bacterium]|nr:phosphate acyltransferase PlsX [Calditrichota bacterium]MCB0268032.1 phosphate acyltransferase PlsX [Calditrichota bacterium]MCB9067742.1 phosphate acyltransferase PlsX [Calditrichia bacterium]
MGYHSIVIDAMGGDFAPTEIIKGAEEACKENKQFRCIFVGDEVKIWEQLEQASIPDDRYEIIHTDQYISMKDSPKEALIEKPEASIAIAAQLIKDGKGDALVSAGNTGATVLACSKIIPRMPGVERGVLAAVFPALEQRVSTSGVSIMLDVGATLHCTMNQLVSFAIMGIHYAQEILGIQNPRVGLLNIGEEETKGHDVLVETHKMLKKMSNINFIGNVEGKDILRGVADVIVTEGYTGNILLKGLEGMAEVFMDLGKDIWKNGVMSKVGIAMMAPRLKKLKTRLDYSEYGGAPMLGFSKLVIKAHGRSKAKAIKNAILLADKSAGQQFIKHIEDSMKQFYLSMFERI